MINNINISLFSVLGIIAHYISTIILSIPTISHIFNNELLGKMFVVFTYPKFYIMIFIMPLIILLPDILYTLIKSIYFPSVVDVVIYNKDKYINDLKPIKLGKIVNGKIESSQNGISPNIESNKSQAVSISPFINNKIDKLSYREVFDKSPKSDVMKKDEGYTAFTNKLQEKRKSNSSIKPDLNDKKIAIPFSASGKDY